SRESNGLQQWFGDAFDGHIFEACKRLVKRAKTGVNKSIQPTTISWALAPPALQSIAQITLWPSRDYLLFFRPFSLPSFDASQSRCRAHSRRRKFGRKERSSSVSRRQQIAKVRRGPDRQT